MKKVLLTLALAGTMISASAQQMYNYFEGADVDANGWLWLDSSAKLNMYCGINTKTKTYKVQLTEAGWEDQDFIAPAPEKKPNIKGYNSAGVQGGEGSKTGGIVLPMAKDFHYIMNNTSFGGGIAFHLPDLAYLSLYISLENKEAFMAIYDADGQDTRYQDTRDFANYWHGEGLESMHNPVPGINYCGTWAEIQDTESYDGIKEVNTYLTHEPGKPVTLWFPSLTDGHQVIIHGIKLLTYTNAADGTPGTPDEAAVDEIFSENEDVNAPAYNLMGVPVDDSYKGIIIKNGKKIIRK